MHEDGTDCYQARVRDARGREHHFDVSLPRRDEGRRRGGDSSPRRLDYYGPGCAAGTAHGCSATDVSWDRLVGVLIAGATWTARARAASPVVVPEGPAKEEDAKKGETTANGATAGVGRRIAVLWKSERRYFAGNVAAYDAVNGKHHVRYDDGDEEWIALSRHDVKYHAMPLEAAEPEKNAGAKRPAAGRKRKADAAEDAPETSGEDEDDDDDDDDDDDERRRRGRGR